MKNIKVLGKRLATEKKSIIKNEIIPQNAEKKFFA